MPDALVVYAPPVQELGPVRSAAYRLIGLGSCQIGGDKHEYRCELSLSDEARRNGWTGAALENRFRDLVTDENLRQQIEIQTKDVKNLILALAFGAIAAKEKHSEPV